LVKYLYFLKKEFDEKINNNTIPEISFKTYIKKMKSIRYIVIFDLNQYPLYIYDLESSKIIDAQKCKILYQINNHSFKKPFVTPTIKYYYYCIEFFNKINYFNNENQRQKFLDLMKQIIIEFNTNYCQYFSDDNLFGKDDNGEGYDDNDDDDDDDDNSIIPYNDNISLYHTNVSEKELNINTSLFDNLNNFNKVNIINNISEKNKEVRFKLPSFSSEFPFKVYNNSIVIEDNDNVDNSIIPYNNNNNKILKKRKRN
jgi:hypothetical protein